MKSGVISNHPLIFKCISQTMTCLCFGAGTRVHLGDWPELTFGCQPVDFTHHETNYQSDVKMVHITDVAKECPRVSVNFISHINSCLWLQEEKPKTTYPLSMTWVSCAGFQDEELQTAHLMSFTWAPFTWACSRDVKLLPNQSITHLIACSADGVINSTQCYKPHLPGYL